MSYYDRDKSDAQPKMQWPKPHFGSVAEYQVSAWPFCYRKNALKSTENLEIDFEGVTRWITISAMTNAIKVSFADPTALDEFGSPVGWVTYFTVPASTTTDRLEVKCTKIWIQAAGADSDISILAGVTSIGTSQFPDISGRTGVSHT